MIDLSSAKRTVATILKNHVQNKRSLFRAIGQDQGKIYELFVLSILVFELNQAGCRIRSNKNFVRFKGKPGFINNNDTEFEIYNHENSFIGSIHLNIQYYTIGAQLAGANQDRSFFHELDISIVRPTSVNAPRYYELMLGVECKSSGKMSKAYVREVLGLRREMSFYTCGSTDQSLLSVELAGAWNIDVSADPASELYLAFSDVRRGKHYKAAPSMFSVFLVGLRP